MPKLEIPVHGTHCKKCRKLPLPEFLTWTLPRKASNLASNLCKSSRTSWTDMYISPLAFTSIKLRAILPMEVKSSSSASWSAEESIKSYTAPEKVDFSSHLGLVQVSNYFDPRKDVNKYSRKHTCTSCIGGYQLLKRVWVCLLDLTSMTTKKEAFHMTKRESTKRQ